MKLGHLPIHVRYYPGETLDSYAARLAAANHSSVGDIETAAYQHGWVKSRARKSPERFGLWEKLADLPPHTIANPTQTGLNKYTPHPLCIRCTQQTPVLGWLTNSGVICLRHQIAHAHTYIKATPEQIQAERDYRTHLAPAGLHPHHRIITTAHNLAQFENQQPATPQGPALAENATHLLTYYPDTVRIAINTMRSKPATRHQHTPKILRTA